MGTSLAMTLASRERHPMDERLIFASRRKLRGMQLGALVVAAALVLGGVYLGFSRFDWAVAMSLMLGSALVVTGLEWRVRRPLPELRLSADGIEGAFGLIEWGDVAGVLLRERLGLSARGVVVSLRPNARLLPPSREFAEVSDEVQRVRADRIELETRHLELEPDALAREIERFRMAVAAE